MRFTLRATLSGGAPVTPAKAGMTGKGGYVTGNGGCQNLLVSLTVISSTHFTQS